VHVSAGAQIGGVIEPVGALPVIVEDDALVGGNTGIYEGAIVKTAPSSAPVRSSPARRPFTISCAAKSSNLPRIVR
jgi:hypothetical protein